MVIVLTIAFVVNTGILLFFLVRQQRVNHGNENVAQFMLEFQKELNSVRVELKDQVLQASREMNDHLSKNANFLTDTHKNYQTSVSQMQHRLGELQEATKSMVDIGKDISSLQDILRAPKLRGNFGELFLEELLRQILPDDNYVMQYGFQDGRKVDAVVRVGEGLIPIDAKFPLENFRRLLDAENENDEKISRKAFFSDVRKHIDSIAAKYIVPDEGTFEFAMMYIPAENVYYETIIKDESQSENLSTYALKKRVIPVSPNSFYAYLQAIARGLRGLKIEKSAQMILESLGQMEADFNRVMVDFDKTGSHLSNAQSSYDRSLKGFEKMRTRLSAIEVDEKKSMVTDLSE